MSGIFQARSGIPITVTDTRGSSLQAVRGNERPNCVGNPVPSNQSIDTWIDIRLNFLWRGWFVYVGS